MTLTLTKNARLASQRVSKSPGIVLQFDGINTIFGSASIERVIEIGDEGLLIGGGWKIGGSVPVPGQSTSIGFDTSFGSTTTTIDFQLNPDRGFGSGVSSMQVSLIDDKANSILQIVANNEMIGRKCKIWISPDFDETTFPDDYIIIFRGIVDDIQGSPGGVVFNISHPDQKKRQSIYEKATPSLDEALDASETTITLDSTSNLLDSITGPDGSEDSSISFYIRVDDEIIEYTGISGANITGCTRGALGTTAATHDNETECESFYRLEGNVIDMALKLMLSGWNGGYASGISPTSVEYVDDSIAAPANSIFFNNVNLNLEYGLVEGDYITTTNFSNGANNVSLKVVSEIVNTTVGDYIVVDGVTFVEEVMPPSAAVVAFRSKYDTLPDGLKMGPDEVDIEEHENLKNLFLSTFSVDLYLKDTVESGKELIEQQLYKPIAAYSAPRKARASVGYHIGPLPTTAIKTLDNTNVVDASKIVKKRSLGKNFYNTIIYKYDEDTLEEKFLKGVVSTNATSKSQIPVGNKSLIIEAKGLRAAVVANSASSRLLNRYAFGAEYIDSVRTDFKTGFNIEIGDLVILDGTDLQIADFVSGDRSADPKLYEIIRKRMDLKTGKIDLGLVDTNYSLASRYALVSPSSKVKTGLSASSFVIKESYGGTAFGADEYLKWQRYDNLVVRVRNETFTTSATAGVSQFTGNTVLLSSSLGFTPSADNIMELAGYSTATDQLKLLYAFAASGAASGASAFADGGPSYVLL